MDSQPAEISNYVKFAPTGADEQETIMLANRQSQMATITMSLHSKLPKRAVISCEYGYIEIMEYPRADRAWIVEAESGKDMKSRPVKHQKHYSMKWKIWNWRQDKESEYYALRGYPRCDGNHDKS